MSNTAIFMANVNTFVLQTSKDYDMHYHVVMKFYEKHKKDGVLSSEFYTDLENYIEERRKS